MVNQRDKMNNNQRDNLYQYFKALSLEHYEAHPFYTLDSDNILFDNKPSDCQDRAYALADYAKNELYLKPKFLWQLWWKKVLTSHVCCLFEDRVWDATWTRNGKPDYWDYNIDSYLQDGRADLHLITPYWVRYIVR